MLKITFWTDVLFCLVFALMFATGLYYDNYVFIGFGAFGFILTVLMDKKTG